MTQTLQQALIKAGLVSKEKVKKTDGGHRGRAVSPPIQARSRLGRSERKPGFIEGKHHHHLRTECEACRKTSPDVEYYEHKNRSLDKRWLCVKCADTHNISDEFRQTVQSQHAKSGLFRRQYGATKVFK